MPKAKKTVKTALKKAAGSAPQKRLHVIYKGRVQGVGFRYTAEGVAMAVGVTGWVRNLPDGDVELTAEGTEKQLNDTLECIQKSEVGKHIRKTVIDWQEAKKEFTEFRVEFIY